MRLTLNISPCPNDTFMFEAMLAGRIDTRGLEFDVRFLDIEELNERVMAPDGPDISKISYAVLPAIYDRYKVLDSGSALGHGNGPLLVSRQNESELRVAVPGIYTTANLLMNRLFPELTDRTPVLFSQIAPAVARGEFDAGVLIHEGRFTYREHGLELVCDLGEEWARVTKGLPLPLGAIVAKRSLPEEVIRRVEEVLRESIRFAIEHSEVSRPFVKAHAQEMADEVIDNHIALFVNDNSLSLSSEAKKAIKELTGIKI